MASFVGMTRYTWLPGVLRAWQTSLATLHVTLTGKYVMLSKPRDAPELSESVALASEGAKDTMHHYDFFYEYTYIFLIIRFF